MDTIIIQSNDISFEEFAQQHEKDVKLIPNQYGLDGALILSIAIPIIYDLIKELVKYLNKKKKEKEAEGKLSESDHPVIQIIMPDSTTISIPLIPGIMLDYETIMKEIQK